ncbi:unnamed protein product [Caenorhabditis sp. 36 PRJEB53466]|nr:unnamed protein product [Caenorhabditis sp. 36 PRJEB53466]
MLRFVIFLSGIYGQILLQNVIDPSFVNENDLELEFVQAVWRHGDRAALWELYPISEANWTFGGGGFGELTPRGMSQLHRLGAIFRQKYVTDQQFLKHRYAAKEVYIRSTDVNRTIISAQSLLYGMYPPGAWNVQGVDYPNSVDWQQGFTFVPIHVDGNDACAVNQKCQCSRLATLLTLSDELPEVQTAHATMLEMNRRVAGFYNITANVETFYEYPDAWKCQRNYFNESLYQQLPWYSEDLYEEAQRAQAPYKQFQEGHFTNSSVVDGIDVGREIKTLVGGPMLAEIYNRGQEKLECSASPTNCTSYTKPLKFYGYSSHDMIVYGLLVLLDIADLVQTVDGWPDYASAVVFEFYSNPDTDEQFFKVLYRDNAENPLAEVTHRIPVCNGATVCSMQNLQNIAEYYTPKPDFKTACKTPLNLDKASTTSSALSGTILLISTLISTYFM